MEKYTVKGKVTCKSRTDGSVIASWFKELEIEAISKAEALKLGEMKIRAEYDDASVESHAELEAIGQGGSVSNAPVAPPVSQPATTAAPFGSAPNNRPSTFGEGGSSSPSAPASDDKPRFRI